MQNYLIGSFQKQTKFDTGSLFNAIIMTGEHFFRITLPDAMHKKTQVRLNKIQTLNVINSENVLLCVHSPTMVPYLGHFYLQVQPNYCQLYLKCHIVTSWQFWG
jgi:hypothetical protein